MAETNQEARIPVYINDEQAIAKLKELQREAARLSELSKNALGDPKELQRINKEIKKNSQEMNTLKKSAFDVGEVLKKLSSASINDMQKAAAKLKYEMKGLNTNTKEYLDLKKKYDQIDTRIKEVTGKITEQKGAVSKLIGIAKGLLPAFGFGALAGAAALAAKNIVKSTDTLSTKWAVFMGGMKEATNEFYRTLATGDWNNFISNMREAVNVGRQYEETLDDIEERQRGLSVAEADALKPIADLEERVRNATLSRDERIKAAEERINIEEELTGKRIRLQNEEFDNELLLAKQATKLSENRILQIIREVDTSTRARAVAFNKYREELNDIEESNARISAQTKSVVAETPRQKELKALIGAASSDVKAYANELVQMGHATDDVLNKVVASYTKAQEARASGQENTKRIRSQMYSLIKKESDEEARATIENAKGEIQAYGDIKSAIKDVETELRNYLTTSIDVSNVEEELAARRIAQLVDVDNQMAIQQENMLAQFDLQRNQSEIQRRQEIADAEKTGASIALINEKYAKEEERIEFEKNQTKLGLAAGFFGNMATIFGKQTAVGKAAAIAETTINTYASATAAFKSLAAIPVVGPALGAAAAGAAIAAGIANVREIIKVDAKSVGKGKKAGGYADSASSDDQVAGYYHANEFIASAPAVRNPTVKPVLDLIDMAQRSGRVANLNLGAALTGYGRKEGGYAAGSSSGSSTAPSAMSLPAGFGQNPELLKAIDRLNSNLESGIKAKLFYRELEDYTEEVKSVRDSANL
jgi:hypothetical protein